ncbi:PfkB family carbohydrate kinase [Rhodovulum marinum]|uniref:pyridoxal kinase n=1 Tax=Rhodovulum marinum TaxID=320662 RepID=A0A4R2Q601_9RHOB|nr:pyridoxal kinase [Rhodovulum marinum]TCP43258.1 pyridoxine kinase [Rhodovulum marinum]
MARIVMLSSWVAHGHVGLCAAAPAVQALGHGVTQLPTTILSNHPGWPRVAGAPLPAPRIAAMIEALAGNGWLAGVDAVLTGYLPTPAHVDLAVGLIERLQAGGARPRVVVDPVLGDDPGGLYIAEDAARALRDSLVPLAGILTPNRFELGWLTGLRADDPEGVLTAAQALRAGSGARVLVTSTPVSADETGVLGVDTDGARLWRSPRRAGVPHGVGDVFAGLVAAGLTPGAALGHLAALIEASLGHDHLQIAEAAAEWTGARPLVAEDMPGVTEG